MNVDISVNWVEIVDTANITIFISYKDNNIFIYKIFKDYLVILSGHSGNTDMGGMGDMPEIIICVSIVDITSYLQIFFCYFFFYTSIRCTSVLN